MRKPVPLRLLLVWAFLFILPAPEARAQTESQIDRLRSLSMEELLELRVITSSKREERVVDAPASLLVISREDIRRAGYRTLKDILQNVPGMYVVNDYSNDVIYGIRGYWNNVPNENIVFLIDGVEQLDEYNNSHNSILLDLPVSAIDRIEIVRGPMSVQYGTGAFYGVVNIITNLASQQPPEQRLTVQSGSQELRHAALRLAGGSDRGRWAFAASYKQSQGLSIPVADLTTGSFPGAAASTDGYLKGRTAGLFFSGAFGDVRVAGGYVAGRHGIISDPSSPPVRENVNVQLVKLYGGVTYSRPVDERVTLRGSVTFIQHLRDVALDIGTAVRIVGRSGYGSTALGGELGADAQLTPEVTLSGGAMLRVVPEVYANFFAPAQTPGDQLISLAPRSTILSTGVFALARWEATDVMTLFGGLRFEQVSPYTQRTLRYIGTDTSGSLLRASPRVQDITPNAALIYRLGDLGVAKLVYGKGVKHPSFQSTVSERVSETIETVEFAYLGEPYEGLRVDASIFWNRLKTVARRRVTSGGSLVTIFDRSARINTIGTELSVTLQPFTGFECTLAGVFQRSREDGLEALELAHSPAGACYFRASYRPLSDLTLSLLGRYVSPMKAYYDKTAESPPGSGMFGRYLGNPSPSTTVLDANILIQNILDFPLSIAMSVENITNAPQRYPTTLSLRWADKGTLGPGREFSLGLLYEL